MDLPWNPAVLEQRIGRVHRLGQSQPVRVVNFVSQGTIEEGMLSVLKFKKSLFAGVLDGGEKEVFLGGSRLTKFMETVERATGAIPETAAEERDGTPSEGPNGVGEQAPVELESEPPAPSPAAAPQPEPWAGLVQTGLTLLEQLATAARSGSAPVPEGRPGVSIVKRDEQTGEMYLKLPMPSPEVLDRALQAFSTLLEHFGRK
jgi:hypothetical protein